MFNYVDFIIAFLIAGITTFLATYLVKKFAVKIGAVDFPNHRKIHTIIKPRLGGIAIFIGSFFGTLYIHPFHEHLPEILLGAIVILITGAMDDLYNIRPVIKLSGQLIAASFLISDGLIIERVTLPIVGMVDLGFASVLITVLWVVGITNAINLIDGLDGLATGVTAIAFLSMFVMAIIDGQYVAAVLCVVFIGANIGFLFHNFYPATIYMGDAGSNLLGYMIAVVSMLGLFKNIALLGFIIPMIVLAIPIFDTLYAIVRRAHQKENIMAADNKHIHYRLMENGYSHRKSVLIIYAFSALFGAMAVMFSNSSLILSFVITVFVLILLHLLAEVSGLVLNGKRPVLNTLHKIFLRKQRGKE
ncbi:MAG TPA: MraY family glycosyltransferase [Bacillota bacterium]|nr:MraY family glycosyltransferase [Bacillota bacterium]